MLKPEDVICDKRFDERLTLKDIKDFKDNIKLKPTAIKELTVNKFLHICRIMYDANNRSSYDAEWSDEEVYCRNKGIRKNQTAWYYLKDKDSGSVMEKIINHRALGYHFEEVKYNGLCQHLGWVSANHADGVIISINTNLSDGVKRKWMILAFNALAEAGIILELRDKEECLKYIEE